jgi:uncharacterized membrane protein HdeD (DUF308 family)/sporulation protein YlmC with PRC-barrel domain
MTTNDASSPAGRGVLRTLGRNWWALALRGVAAILFGILAFAWPGITLFVLVLFFGAYMLVDGIFAIVAAVRAAGREARWWLLLIEGVLGVLAGLVAAFWPGLTALALLYFIAAWAIVTGILEIAAAVRLRREIAGEWALGLSGLLSLLFGVLLVVIPAPAGILSLLWLIGVYAIAFGVVLLVLAFRVRNQSGTDNTEANESSRSTAEQRFSEGNDLVRVGDSTSADDTQATGDTPGAEDPAQEDVRGREVLDRSGREVGTVEDSYVDREGSTARFLVVGAAPGFNGRRFLIPTEAVGGISDEEVTLNQDRDKVADSPSFEGENGPIASTRSPSTATTATPERWCHRAQ